MKRSRKSNRVSWASGVNLFQVRLFLSDDCPSRVGTRNQDPLQRKMSTLQNSAGEECNDPAPGFESFKSLVSSKEVTQIRIQWRCPPKLVVRSDWLVAAGEESQEAGTQKLREMKVPEAIYPRLSSVPPCPAVSLGIEGESYDDSITPIIPLTPIEEFVDEAAMDIPSDVSAPPKIPITYQLPAPIQDLSFSGIPISLYGSTPALVTPVSEKAEPGKLPNSGADIITAASAAFAALAKIREQGSMIDTELLVKIFSDPKMVEKLMKGGEPLANNSTTSIALSRPASSLNPSSCPIASSVLSATTEKQSLLNAIVRSSVPPSPLFTLPSASLSVNTSFLSVPSEAQPRVATVPAQSGKISESGFKRDYQSISMQPVPLVNNFSMQPNPSKPSLSQLPIQQNAVPVSSVVAMQPNPHLEPNPLKPILSQFPIQQNPLSKSSVVAVKPNPHLNLNASDFHTSVTQSNTVPCPPVPVAPPINSLKDINYLKNLVREHGTEKCEMQTQNGRHYNRLQNHKVVNEVNTNERKPMFQKPCMYFQSSKRFRNGMDCRYRHDFHQLETGRPLEAPASKRMRFNGY